MNSKRTLARFFVVLILGYLNWANLAQAKPDTMGQFYEQPQPSVIQNKVEKFVTSDLDGNGFPDIVMVSYLGSALSILMNQGDGTFGAECITPLPNVLPQGYPARPTGVAIADFNQDQKPDLVVTENYSATAHLYYQLPSAAMTCPNLSYAPLPSCPKGFHVAAADINLDGTPDVAIACNFEVAINFNVGTVGGFAQFLPPQTTGQVAYPRDLLVADFDGDNLPDIITSMGNLSPGPRWAQSYMPNPNPPPGSGPPQPPSNVWQGTPLAPLQLSGPLGTPPFQNLAATSLALGDWNGDGLTDFLGGFGGFELQLFSNQGFGSFYDYSLAGTALSHRSLIPIDINSDGKLDVVSITPGHVNVQYGDHQTDLLGAQSIATALLNPNHLIAADWDQDGDVDMAYSDATIKEIRTIANEEYSPRAKFIAKRRGFGLFGQISSTWLSDGLKAGVSSNLGNSNQAAAELSFETGPAIGTKLEVTLNADLTGANPGSMKVFAFHLPSQKFIWVKTLVLTGGIAQTTFQINSANLFRSAGGSVRLVLFGQKNQTFDLEIDEMRVSVRP